MLSRRSAAALALLTLLSCAAEPPPADGPLAAQATAAALKSGVPRDLLLAIAQVEGGLLLPKKRLVDADDEVPVGGILELRHGAFNSLARGAELLGTTEEALREDTDLGTEAGAKVLAELGRENAATAGDLASWKKAVEILSGLGDTPYRDEYVRDVFATLRRGGDFRARDGETVHLPPHPEVPEEALGTVRANLGGPPPDYAGATWFTTNCSNKCTAGRPDGNASVDTIVIHDTEGGWAASVSTLQFDGGKSVHYIVDADGSRVGQFLHESDTAWHAGNWCINKHSIGIEHVGYASQTYQSGLYATSKKLVQSIRSRWKVPLDRTHIIGHYQVPNGNKIAECSTPCTDKLNTCETSANYGGAANHRDPGLNWMWCQYMQSLGGSCTCNDAYALWNCTTDKTEAVRCAGGKVEIERCYPCEVQPIGVNDLCHGPDAGTPKPDAGIRPDAATVKPDASTPKPDAGTKPDAATLADDAALPDAEAAVDSDADVPGGTMDGPPDASDDGAGTATKEEPPPSASGAAPSGGCGCSSPGAALPSTLWALAALVTLRRRERAGGKVR